MSALGPVPETLRLKMYDLCGGVCEYCGCNQLENTPHHEPPRSHKGAANDIDHLIWLCRRCHRYAHYQYSKIEEDDYKTFRRWFNNMDIKEDLRQRGNNE